VLAPMFEFNIVCLLTGCIPMSLMIPWVGYDERESPVQGHIDILIKGDEGMRHGIPEEAGGE